jgi:glycosylphosphatidylinositol phospholipase D
MQPPFQQAVVEYILKHYPREASGVWPGQAQRLIAFLLGVVSHSVADITWHDIAASSSVQQGTQCPPRLCDGDSGADAHS